MDKNLYIGEFRVRNCSPYGEYKIIDSLVRGDELKIEYNVSEKQIEVLGAQNNNSTKTWVVIGELEMPEHVRRVVVPMLMGACKSNRFDCLVSYIDVNQPINNCLRLSIWAKK